MAITKRQSSKPDLRRPIDTQSSGRRGGAYSAPKVNKNRDDITQVAAYAPGIKGGKQKRRGKWY